MYPALESHKEVLQGLQNVDAFTQDMFLPEEIDFHLNKQQDSFISEMLDEGFADRQLRLDYVQDIIVQNKTLPVYISSTAPYYESGVAVSYLPGDYRHLLSTRVKIREGVDCDTLLETLEDITYYVSNVPIATNLTVGPYYARVKFVRINADQSETVIIDLKNSGVAEPEDVKNIMEMIAFTANKDSNTTEFYLGKYPDSLKSGNIIADTTLQVLAPDNTIKYKIVTYKPDKVTIDVEVLAGSAMNLRTTKKWETDMLANLAPATKIAAINLDNKEIHERKKNAFTGSNPREPHIGISDGILSTYYTTFLPEEVTIDYLRKPQVISLAEGKGCELATSAARIISNRVVEFLKLVIENPSYREVIGHNEKRDIK